MIRFSADDWMDGVDTAWHPLVGGHAPTWARQWGEDRFGVFADLIVDEVIQRFRWIPPGCFFMGSSDDDLAALAASRVDAAFYNRERGGHTVCITLGFWLADTPCTQALWDTVMPENPSRFRSPDRPVEGVRWYEIQQFSERIRRRIDGLWLTLPSEAQWEYACRAGEQRGTAYAGQFEIRGVGNAPALDPIAWYSGNSGVDFELPEGADSRSWPEKQYDHVHAGSHPVARKSPNAFGLYDMLGNVWEWCSDGLRSYERNETRMDPWGSLTSDDRVIRGGSWDSPAAAVRPTCRMHVVIEHGNHDAGLGFRPSIR